MKKILFTFLFFFLQFSVFGQNRSESDSLKIAISFKEEGQKLIDNGKYLSSIDKMKKAIEAFPRKNLEKKIEAYYLIGYAYQNSRSLDSAQFYYDIGDSYIAESSSSLIKSHKYLNKASMKFTRFETDSAMMYSLLALNFANKTKNKKRKSVALSNIGLIFLNQKNLIKAEEYLSKSLLIGKESKDSITIGNGYCNLGQLDFEKKAYDSAYKKFNKALKIFKKRNHNKGILVSKTYLSKILFFEGKSNEAIALGYELIPLINEFEYSNDLKEIVKNTNKIIKLSEVEDIDSSSVTKAYKLLNENMKISKNTSVSVEQNKAIIQYVENSNNEIDNEEIQISSELTDRMDKSLNIQDSLYQLSLESKYAEIETKYQTEKKENEILKLESDNALKEIEIAKESNTKLMFAAIASLALLSLGILVFYAKHRKRKLLWHSQIAVAKAKQEEHNIIGNELHDNKSKELESVAVELKKQGKLELSEKVDAIRQDIRTLSHELTYIEFSESEFDEQIITLAANYSSPNFKIKRQGFNDVSWDTINDIVKRNLYIVIREGISNAYNHSEATEMVIECSKNKKELIVKMYDNGKGFNKEQVKLGKGLTNIKVRVEEINGKVSIESLKHKGTSIKINILLS